MWKLFAGIGAAMELVFVLLVWTYKGCPDHIEQANPRKARPSETIEEIDRELAR